MWTRWRIDRFECDVKIVYPHLTIAVNLKINHRGMWTLKKNSNVVRHWSTHIHIFFMCFLPFPSAWKNSASRSRASLSLWWYTRGLSAPPASACAAISFKTELQQPAKARANARGSNHVFSDDRCWSRNSSSGVIAWNNTSVVTT